MWAGRLVAACIEPAGLTVERIARVPYLCLGDTLGSRMYELDDAVLVWAGGPSACSVDQWR